MITPNPSVSLVRKIVVLAAVVLLVAGAYALKRINETKAEEAAANAVAIPSNLHVASPLDFAALRSSGLPVIIDYGADSCIPCKEMAPVLEELNKVLAGKAIILFVDVWKYRNLAAGVPIQVIPTQLFFDSNGRPFTPPENFPIQLTAYSLRDTGEHVFTTHEGGLDKSQMLAILTAMGMD
jgi:thioredoxin 1